MNRFFRNLLILPLFVIVLFACSKELVTSESNIQYAPSFKSTSWIDQIDPVEFGKLHNVYLEQVVNEYLSNPSAGYKIAFLAVDIPNISQELQSDIYDHTASISADDMRDSTFQYLSEAAIDLYNDVDYSLDNTSNFNELSSELDVIKTQIESNLSGVDQKVLLVYLETIKSSAYFWYSTDAGGSGLGALYKAIQSGSSSKSDVPDWVKADGRGAGYGMVAWSFSALFGPAAPIGFIYGAVSGAVTNSFLP